MTKSCAFAIAAGLFFFQANGKAAEPPRVERATPPLVPFSAKVPEGLEWEVAITPREESKKTPEPVATASPLSEIDEAAAKRLSIYRERLAASTVNAFHAWYAAGIRREILTFGGREKRERYLKSGMVLYEDAASGQLVMDSREPSASGPVWGVETFRELAWISADHYAGDQVFRGKKCHVYRSRTLPSAPDINDSLGNEMQADEPEPMRWGDREGTTAFIDIETMLPVGMEMPNETWLYKIVGRQSTVQLPDVYAQKVQQMEERAKKLRNKYRVNQ